MIEASLGEGEDLADGTRDNTTVLKLSSRTCHGVCFTSSGLSVTEDGTVVSINDGLDDLGGTSFIGFILTSVMEDLLKLSKLNL